MKIVSNTSPLLNLAAIGEARLLARLFGEVWIPLAVRLEITRLQNSNGRFANVVLPPFARVQPLQNLPLSHALKLQLHAGEAEAIALAVESGATRLLLDEHRARVMARRLGIQTQGCLGILLQAKQQGLISEIRPLVEKLEKEAGFWVGSALRSQVLRAAGE